MPSTDTAAKDFELGIFARYMITTRKYFRQSDVGKFETICILGKAASDIYDTDYFEYAGGDYKLFSVLQYLRTIAETDVHGTAWINTMFVRISAALYTKNVYKHWLNDAPLLNEYADADVQTVVGEYAQFVRKGFDLHRHNFVHDEDTVFAVAAAAFEGHIALSHMYNDYMVGTPFQIAVYDSNAIDGDAVYAHLADADLTVAYVRITEYVQAWIALFEHEEEIVPEATAYEPDSTMGYTVPDTVATVEITEDSTEETVYEELYEDDPDA